MKEPQTIDEEPGGYAPAPWLRPASSPCGETRIVLTHTTWETYETLDRALEDVPGVRLTYLDGLLEIMSPISRLHETLKVILSRLVEAYCYHRDIPFFPHASTTVGEKADETSGEPDESYAFGSDKAIPDLVIEINLTSGGLNKLPRYRRLGIPEVWIWRRDRLLVFVLDETAGYTESRQSRVLPGIDLDLVERCARMPVVTDAVQAFREALGSA